MIVSAERLLDIQVCSEQVAVYGSNGRVYCPCGEGILRADYEGETRIYVCIHCERAFDRAFNLYHRMQ